MNLCRDCEQDISLLGCRTTFQNERNSLILTRIACTKKINTYSNITFRGTDPQIKRQAYIIVNTKALCFSIFLMSGLCLPKVNAEHEDYNFIKQSMDLTSPNEMKTDG